MRASLLPALLLLGLFLLPGCGTTPEQRLEMAQNWLDTGSQWSEGLDEAITAAELVVEQADAALVDVNLPNLDREKVLAVKAEAQEQIAKFRAKKAQIDADILALQTLVEKAQTEGAEVLNEIEFYGQGLKVVGNRVGGDVGGYIALAGTLLGGVAGALAGLAKNLQTRKVLEGVVGSVSALLTSPAVPDRDAATAVLEGTQTPAVETAVRKIIGKS